MALAKKLAKNFVIQLTGNILGQAFFFLGLVHLARVLGPAGFGIWNFAQAWLLYLFRAGDLGLEIYGIREISRVPATTRQLLSEIVIIRFGLACILFGITMIASAVHLLPVESARLVVLFSLAVLPMAFIVEWVFEAHQELVLVSIARVVKGIIFALGVYILVKSSAGIELSVAAYNISLLLPIVVVFAISVSRFGFSLSAGSFKDRIQILRTAFPIGAASILSQISLFFGTMVIGYMLTKMDLGYFSAAHRIIVFLWAYVVSSSWRVLLPTLSRLHQSSLPDFERFVGRFFRIIALFAFPLGLVACIASGKIIPLLYSSEYEPGVVVFQVLTWSLVIGLMRAILEMALIASNNQRQYFRGMLLLVICYIVLTPILTMQFGIGGTALASVVSEFVYFMYVVLYSRAVSASMVLRDFWKPATAFLGSVILAVVFLRFPVSLRILIGLTSYVMCLLALKAVSPDDVLLIRRIFREKEAEAVS